MIKKKYILPVSISIAVVLIFLSVFLIRKSKTICNNKGCFVVDRRQQKQSLEYLEDVDNELKELLNKVLNENDCPLHIKTKIPEVINKTTLSENVYKLLGTTSFTVDKRDIYLCLKNNEGKYYEKNLIMMVVIHEYSHVLCDSQDHTEEFKFINRYLLNKAIKHGLYKPIDFESNNREYCGMTLKHNPL